MEKFVNFIVLISVKKEVVSFEFVGAVFKILEVIFLKIGYKCKHCKVAINLVNVKKFLL